MKKLFLVIASLALGGLAWAASNSACIFNLIPPTSAVQVCQDGSGQMNLQDATGGPVTLSSMNSWQKYISNGSTGVILSTTSLNGGLALWNLPIATVNSLTPSTTGQMVYCTNCAANGGAGTICISTGSTKTYQFVLSTGTVCQ